MSNESDRKNDPLATQTNMWSSLKTLLIYFSIYVTGVATFLIIIANPFTMGTYFSDNSLLPGLVNREFSLLTETEYYIKSLEKFSSRRLLDDSTQLSLATLPVVTNYLKNELDNFGLEAYEQRFSYISDNKQLNGTNIYSIIRGERSTSSESLAICAPFRMNSQSNTISSVALSLALAKYFSSKSYWAKDVIVLFVDRDEHGLSAWLDAHYDIRFRSDFKRLNSKGVYYDSLADGSGPLQAAIVLELMGKQFTGINLKIQGMYGQLPNLDLFNLIVELATRESVTPFFHNKTLPFGISDWELYMHHMETALSFMKTQSTMRSDGLHGLFLSYAIQALTIEGREQENSGRNAILASLLNIGRLTEGVFRSLNNLTERFNRSYYFYILLSLRRFTSIGYYMISFSMLITPILLKAYTIQQQQSNLNKFIGIRCIVLILVALALSLISTFNISTAIFASVLLVPPLLVM